VAPSLPSLGGISGLPADAVAALRKLPDIAENTRVMKEHTAALERVADALDRVAADTGVLGPMDKRMAAIEAAMPVLVEVQGHLARLPETIEELMATVETLQSAVEPLGRLAGRVPGQKKG
jgi:hypothetical protein